MSATVRTLVLGGAAALLVLALGAPAGARPAEPPVVDVQPSLALSPDGRTAHLRLLASCPERWTVVEAVVTVSQPGVSGRTSFPLACTGSWQGASVTVTASGGAFALAPAQVSASVVVERGRTMRADDAVVLQAQPTLLVELAGSAALESGGAAVVLAVSVACPAGASGLESRLVVSQGAAIGVGLYVPVCDGTSHTFAVRVPASQGAYVAGIAQAITLANAEIAGTAFYAFADDGSLDVVG